MPEMTDLELLSALGVEAKPARAAARTPREERVVAAFEEIQRFVDQKGRLPGHGEEKDIFERIYAMRLDRIRTLADCRSLLKEMDHQNLLGDASDGETVPDDIDDETLLAQLGVTTPAEGDITELRHVRPRAKVRAAEEVATRSRCRDFDTFKPIFEAVQQELDSGLRETRPFKDNADVKKGDLFILSGQKVYVADMGDEFITEYDRKDRRLRVIYDNATESDILLRSLQRALNKDKAGRRIVDASAGPLFSGKADDEDVASGTIYVLRTRSDHAVLREYRDVLHKIGVTTGNVQARIANAKLDPTFLMADVELVATYELYNINCRKMENIFHRIFGSAKLNIEIKDRLGLPILPREWFLVPFEAIDEAVERIKNGTISDYVYDVNTAALIQQRTVPTERQENRPVKRRPNR